MLARFNDALDLFAALGGCLVAAVKGVHVEFKVLPDNLGAHLIVVSVACLVELGRKRLEVLFVALLESLKGSKCLTHGILGWLRRRREGRAHAPPIGSLECRRPRGAKDLVNSASASNRSMDEPAHDVLVGFDGRLVKNDVVCVALVKHEGIDARNQQIWVAVNVGRAKEAANDVERNLVG